MLVFHQTAQKKRRNASGLSQSSVSRILRDLKWNPYRLQLRHQMLPHDHQARVVFAQRQLEALAADPALLTNLVFSDEAHFYLNGEVNRWDYRLWSDENPHWFAEEPLHPQKVTVWLGVGIGGVVGPFFWIRKVTMKEV